MKFVSNANQELKCSIFGLMIYSHPERESKDNLIKLQNLKCLWIRLSLTMTAF
jgi:hypothetical protein